MADKILVVEEEQELRGLYKKELEEDGYRVNTAPGGLEALNRLSDEAVDLVVLDLELSDVDGLDCLQGIVELDQNVRVVLTADDSTYSWIFTPGLRMHSWGNLLICVNSRRRLIPYCIPRDIEMKTYDVIAVAASPMTLKLPWEDLESSR